MGFVSRSVSSSIVLVSTMPTGSTYNRTEFVIAVNLIPKNIEAATTYNNFSAFLSSSCNLIGRAGDMVVHNIVRRDMQIQNRRK